MRLNKGTLRHLGFLYTLRTPALSFFFCHDQTQIPWHLPIGVLCDLVKFDSTESGSFDAEPRLDLTVRFKEPRRLHEFLIDYRSAESFSYLFLNQLKMGLIASGRPLAQFNILGKEEMQVLQSIAGGEVDGSPCIKAFVETFNSIYSEAYPAKSAAMKLYAVRWPDLQSTVLSIPLTDSSQVRVEDLLSQLHLPSESCVASLGVRLRAETPLQFLQERCCYGDGFVHLVVFLN